MTLLDEVNGYLENQELDFLWLNGVEIVEDVVIDTTRWSLVNRTILRRGDELVGVEYETGSTEYQDDTEPNGRAFNVVDKQVTRTEYVEVN